MKLAIDASGLPAPLQDHSEELRQSPHYNNAIRYYLEAIREVRSSANSTSDDGMREAILCSLLFTIFESLEGRLNAATKHLNHGVTIIGQLLNAHGYEDFINLSLSKLPPEHIIDHEILRIYRVLDAQSWSYISLNPWPSSLVRWKERTSIRTFAIDPPPQSFGDLAEARQWLHVVEQACHHYNRFTFSTFICGTEDGRPLEPVASADIQAECLGRLTLWYRAFQPLYSETLKHPPTSEIYLQGAALRAAYLTTYVLAQCPILCDVSTQISVTPACRELVRLATELLEHDQEVFRMDDGPIRGLLVAFVRCHDEVVRQEAMRQLKRAHRRDFLWDSQTCFNIGVKCSEVDESELKSGSASVVRVKGYKKDEHTGRWRCVETVLRLLEKGRFKDNSWAEHEVQPSEAYMGVQLPTTSPTTGRWLLYEADGW
jgi:hypothetical protein